MIELAAAAAVLIGTHYGLASTPLRDLLVARLGEGPYRGLFSLIALVALIWLCAGYATAPHVPVWPSTAWAAWLALLVMPLALMLLVAGVSGPNVTSLGAADLLDGDEPARGVLRITRHPVMWAIGLWALLHVLASGDLASIVFFGALGTLALLGTVLQDAKFARRRGTAWQRFRAKTSNVPFAAIAAGRQHLVPAEIGWSRLAAALVLYGALLVLHPWLFGAAPLALSAG